MTATQPEGLDMTNSQWLLDVMGRHDFTIPSVAFDEIINRIELLSASKPAAPDFTAHRLKVAEDCNERLMNACTDTGCPDGVNMAEWIRGLDMLAASPAAPAQSAHPDDLAVDIFALQMKDKLRQSREKGRSGWEGCAPAVLSQMLREHVEKGDPRDVANFCMMLWHHSAPISAVVLDDQRAALSDVQVVGCMDAADKALRGRVFEGPGARDIAWAHALIEAARAASPQPVAQTERALTGEQVQAIMTQVQVFASAYSLVGGRFDNGDGFEHSEAMKEEIRALLTAARPASGETE